MGDYRAYILDIDGHRFIWALFGPKIFCPFNLMTSPRSTRQNSLPTNMMLKSGRAVDWWLDCLPAKNRLDFRYAWMVDGILSDSPSRSR